MADDLTEDDSRRMEGKLLIDNSEVGDNNKSDTDCWGLKRSDLNTTIGVKLDILNFVVGDKL